MLVDAEVGIVVEVDALVLYVKSKLRFMLMCLRWSIPMSREINLNIMVEY